MWMACILCNWRLFFVDDSFTMPCFVNGVLNRFLPCFRHQLNWGTTFHLQLCSSSASALAGHFPRYRRSIFSISYSFYHEIAYFDYSCFHFYPYPTSSLLTSTPYSLKNLGTGHIQRIIHSKGHIFTDNNRSNFSKTRTCQSHAVTAVIILP